MRHLKSGRKLNRDAAHRKALMRNLTAALFEHEEIVTTVAKAKELRRFAERLITVAKRNTLHARRLVLSRLVNKEATKKLFGEIAPRFADRSGGYTRIVKRSQPRLGDAGPTAIISLVQEGESKVARPVAPAPTVTEEKESD
jgi:large subunit ribosomal protein L17